MRRPTIDQIIEKFHLKSLPVEGGLFWQSYLSNEMISHDCLPDRYDSAHPYGSAIYYLLTPDDDSFSAMHKLKSDEIYHFYLGDPVEMLLLHPDGKHEVIHYGQDILSDQKVQYPVPAGVWQGSRLMAGGEFALLGTTMAPGYLDEDVEFGGYQELSRQYPTAAGMIRRLTRQ